MRFALLVVAFVTAALSAQEKREPVRGSAVLDGKPWPAATVHLLSRPLPQDERIGTADEPSATTDEKGRFTVQLLAGRQYTAWAVEELGDNRYRASLPVERVIAGRPLELIADGPRTRYELSFLGLDEWRAKGKVIARALSRTDQRFVFETTLSGDTWLLPPMPGRSAGLEVLCDGLPFFQWPATVDLTTAPARPMKLPSPHAVRFKVVDAAGKPVPEAVLALRTTDLPEGSRTHEWPLATTDKNGEAVTTLPIAANQALQWVNYAFSVQAPGFVPVGNIARMDIKADHDGSKDPPAMTLPLKPGAKHELRLSRGEQPFAARVVCNTPGATVGDMPSAFGDSLRHLVPDAGGRLQVLRVPHEGVIVIGTADSLHRPVELGAPLHPMALLGVIAAGEQREKIAWDLDVLQPLELHVLSPDGTPVDAARLAVLVDPGPGNDHARPRLGCKRALSGLCTDRSGRIAALIPADQRVTVAAWTDEGFAVAADVTAARDKTPIVMRLAKVSTVPGWVVGKDGMPVAFGEVECYVFAGDAATASLAEAIKLLEVPTNGDGMFLMPLFPGLQYSMRGVATPAGDHYLTKSWTVGKDEPEELVLDLRKAR